MNGVNILITGAYGRVGTAIIDYLGDNSDYNFSYFSRSDRPSDHPYGQYDTIQGDITNKDEITAAMESQDVVIHLAATPLVDSPWEEVLQSNIIGAYNTFQAASEQGVMKIIFASSNHAVGMYEKERAPELYEPGNEFKIDHKVPVRPDSYYGVSKCFGEDLGRFYVDTQNISFYALRIGSLRDEEYDSPYGIAERGVKSGKWNREDKKYEEEVNRMRCTWLSRRDMGHLAECCLQDETVEFDIFYGISDNDHRWLDISHAREVLNYRPKDNAEDYIQPSKQ